MLALVAAALLEQTPLIQCSQYAQKNAPQQKTLWDGYLLTIGPSDTGGCEAVVRDAKGKPVLRTVGYSVILDADETGRDLDGDGKPDLVLNTDTGGGNHCCWGFEVYSLSPTPRKLFDVGGSGAVDFQHDATGVLIWQRVGGSAAFTSMAARPFAEQLFRVRAGRLVDVTADYAAQLLSDDWRDFSQAKGELTPEKLARLARDGGVDALDNEAVVSALLSRALQQALCRKYDAALATLNLWPADSRAAMKAEFAKWIREDRPDFATRLAPAR